LCGYISIFYLSLPPLQLGLLWLVSGIGLIAFYVFKNLVDPKATKLKERTKELNCLYKIFKLTQNSEVSVEKVMQETVDIIPESWQYPEVCCCRITYQNQEFQSPDFKESEWKLSCNFSSEAGFQGKIEVFYTAERPEAFEGPFLEEEKQLLCNLAYNLQLFIERNQTIKLLHKLNEKLHLTLDSIGDGVITTDDKRKISKMNPVAEKLTGWSLAEARNRYIEEVFDISSSITDEKAKNPVETVLTTGSVKALASHTQLTSREGMVYQIADSAAPIVTKNNEIIGAILVFRDISNEYFFQTKLKLSEIRFRELFNRMSNSVAIFEAVDDDKEFKFLDFNHAAEKTENISKKELLGKSVSEVFPGVKDFGLFEVFQKVWKTGEPEHFPLKYYEDKRITGWRDNYVFKLPTGELVAFYEDITARKKAEIQLEGLNRIKEELLGNFTLHEKMEKITNCIIDILGAKFALIWITDKGDLCQKQCPFASNNDLKHLCPHHDFCLHLIASATRDKTNEAKDNFLIRIPHSAYKLGKIASGEEEALFNNNLEVIEEVENKNIFQEQEIKSCFAKRIPSPENNNQNGVLAVYSGYEMDKQDHEFLKSLADTVSEVLRSSLYEAKLIESKNDLDKFFEFAPVAIEVSDRNGSILKINQKHKELFGYAIDEISTRDKWYAKAYPEKNYRDFVKDIWEKDLKNSGETKTETYPREFNISCKDGSTKNIIVTAKPGSNKTLVTFVDITGRRKLEAQLIQAQKMESVGRLAGGVAHDYNNILSVIIGYSELALEQHQDIESIKSDVKEILTAAKKSRDITRQLLAFARRDTIKPEVLDINEKIDNMIQMLRKLLGENIELIWKPAENTWPVNLDPSQLDQILTNLCVNSRDAIKNTGKIVIETGNRTFDQEYCDEHEGFVEGDFISLSISDNGRGMKKQEIENIFDPFFTTKEVGEGTGLGLSMVYGIVKQNNGFINVYSEPGRGTTFRLYFPKHAGKVKKIAHPKPHKPAKGNKETILVVEDEPMILKLTEKILSKMNYNIITAETPESALKTSARHSDTISLLITDVVMPKMNGKKLAKKIQARNPDIKVLFMSGYTADVIVEHGVLSNGIHFIQKPFSKNDLAAKVHEILNS
ncbi:MAG: PAS domain S-box protein, partial [Candidatus Rifleibacteriota bacterium]